METKLDPNAFLMETGKVPSFKWANCKIGEGIKGTIAREPEVQQQRHYESDEPLFWDNGKPRLQLRLVLKTNLRDADLEDDEGLRAVFVKGRMHKAVAEAVRKSGAKGLEVGGELEVILSALIPTFNDNGKPMKDAYDFTASYAPVNKLDLVAEPEASSTVQAETAQPKETGFKLPDGMTQEAFDALPPSVRDVLLKKNPDDPPF